MIIKLNEEQIERLYDFFDFEEGDKVEEAELDDETNCFKITYYDKEGVLIVYDFDGYKEQFEVDQIMGDCETPAYYETEEEYEVFAESIHGSDLTIFYSLEEAIESAREWAKKSHCDIAVVKVKRELAARYEGKAKVNQD